MMMIMMMMMMIIIIIKKLGLGLSRLCLATIEQLWHWEELFAVLKTWWYFCVLSNFCAKYRPRANKKKINDFIENFKLCEFLRF